MAVLNPSPPVLSVRELRKVQGTAVAVEGF
jgi:hypothetical protein